MAKTGQAFKRRLLASMIHEQGQDQGSEIRANAIP